MLWYRFESFPCLRSAAIVEMPPLRRQRAKPRLFHHTTQQLAVGALLFRNFSSCHQRRLIGDVRLRTEIVNLRTHRQRVAEAVGNAYVHSQAIIVEPSSMRRVRHIAALRRALHHVPHLLLHRHRARSIVDNKPQVRTATTQQALSLQQAPHRQWVQIRLAQVGIKHTAHKIVGTRIHQVDEYRRVTLGDILVAQRIKPERRAAFRRLLLCPRLSRWDSLAWRGILSASACQQRNQKDKRQQTSHFLTLTF